MVTRTYSKLFLAIGLGCVAFSTLYIGFQYSQQDCQRTQDDEQVIIQYADEPPVQEIIQILPEADGSFEDILRFYSKFNSLDTRHLNCIALNDPRWPAESTDNITRDFRELFFRYADFHRQKMAKVNMSDLAGSLKSDSRFLVLNIGNKNGLGNVNMAATSSLVVAIMMKRVLLVEYDAEISGIFCQFMLPNALHRSIQRVPEPRRKFWGDVMYHTDGLPADIQEVYINLYWHRQANSRTFFIRDTEMKLISSVNILRIESDQYYIPGLMLHPTFGPMLQRMFPDHDVYRRLFPLAFAPSNEVWKQSLQIISQFDFSKQYVVGMQLRLFSGYSEAFKNEIKYCFDQESEVLEVPEGKSIAFLIISLYSEPQKDILAELKARGINIENIKLFQPSNDGEQKFASGSQLHDAFAEALALALCDRVVVSSMSTLGYQALAVHQKEPFYFLARGQSPYGPNRYCWKRGDRHNDPCFHTPQMNYYKEIGFDTARLGIKQCIDVPDGYSLS